MVRPAIAFAFVPHPPAPPNPNPAGFAEAKLGAPRLNGMLDVEEEEAMGAKPSWLEPPPPPKLIGAAVGNAKPVGVPKGDDGGCKSCRGGCGDAIVRAVAERRGRVDEDLGACLIAMSS